MKDHEAKAVADEALLAVLGPDIFVRSSVTPGYDHHDEPSLFVVAHLKPGSDVVSGRAAREAMVALGRAFEARDEFRFPYLSFDYPDDEPLDEQGAEALAQ